jgi:hypothetical protein
MLNSSDYALQFTEPNRQMYITEKVKCYLFYIYGRKKTLIRFMPDKNWWLSMTIMWYCLVIGRLTKDSNQIKNKNIDI